MWHYLLYFLIGGSVATAVAYFGSRGSGIMAAFMASLPLLFLLNIILMYQNGGIAASVSYAKGSLLFLPAFVCYSLLAIWLLPHLGIIKSLLFGIPIYAAATIVVKKIGPKPRALATIVGYEQHQRPQ